LETLLINHPSYNGRKSEMLRKWLSLLRRTERYTPQRTVQGRSFPRNACTSRHSHSLCFTELFFCSDFSFQSTKSRSSSPSQSSPYLSDSHHIFLGCFVSKGKTVVFFFEWKEKVYCLQIADVRYFQMVQSSKINYC